MAALADLGLQNATRREGYSGVWYGEKKLASVGVAITSKWVTWHGVALNVSTNLTYFRRINPCGLPAEVMTSVSALVGCEVEVADVKALLAAHLGSALHRRAA